VTHPLFCTWFVQTNRYENCLGVTPFVNFTDDYGMSIFKMGVAMRGVEILGVTHVQVWGLGCCGVSFSVAFEVCSSNLGCKNLIWGVEFFLRSLIFKSSRGPTLCLPHKCDNDVAPMWHLHGS
jgi:hypothetical protein